MNSSKNHIALDLLTLESAPEDPLPDAAQDALFGADLQTFAILDAAKCPGLVEMLEQSGLPHMCLFQGAARDELGDVAPWIVELNPKADLTRALLSRDDRDPPWFLWDKEMTIFLRSSETLENVRRHFRKFTKVQDEDGKVFYFRFYEPEILPGYLAGLNSEKRRAFMGPVAQIWCPTGRALVRVSA